MGVLDHPLTRCFSSFASCGDCDEGKGLFHLCFVQVAHWQYLQELSYHHDRCTTTAAAQRSVELLLLPLLDVILSPSSSGNSFSAHLFSNTVIMPIFGHGRHRRSYLR